MMIKKKIKKKPSILTPAPEGSRGLKIVIYGPPGAGKTSLAAQFPDPLFIVDDQEEGIKDLQEFGLAPKGIETITVDKFADLKEETDNVLTKGIKTLVLDSLTGMEKLCFLHHCQENFDGDWSRTGFFSFQQGPKNAAKTDWSEYIHTLESISKHGINVVLLAHSATKNNPNPFGADFDKIVPYLDKETWAYTSRWAQAILLFTFQQEVKKERGETRNKAVEESFSRILHCQPAPQHDAKNRYGLPPYIDAGETPKEAFNNLWQAINKQRAS